MYISTQTLEELVEEKIYMLYDFCILLRNKKHKRDDPREETVRQMLIACGNENRINNALHGLLSGDYSLEELLEMKGFDMTA